MLLRVYKGLTSAGRPFINWLLERRLAAGKEDRHRREERRGIPSLERPPGGVVWVHSASVGEAISALPVIKRLAAMGLPVLVTTGTVTSAQIMSKRLPRGAFHQYAPVDRSAWVMNFLDHWKPAAAIWVESEIWPNTLTELAKRKIPAALVNARLSERSFRRWRHARGVAEKLFGGFQVILAQTADDASRLEALGAVGVRALGNLKFAADPLPADPMAFAALQRAIGQRPVWAIASSHQGEEGMAATVHDRLIEQFPDLLTIIVPRHPERGEEIEHLLHQRGLWTARRSQEALPRPELQTYLVDTIGDLGLVYRVAPVVVIGGSFIAHGGHNPIEPARLGSVSLHGPSMYNFSEIVRELKEAGATIEAAGVDDLTRHLSRLLSEPEQRAMPATAGRRVAERHANVAEQVMEALAPVISGALALNRR